MDSFKKIGLLFAPFIILSIFLMTTDPFRIPLVLIVVPFILIGVGVFRLVAAVLRSVSLSNRKARLIASLVTCITLLLALLQSIRQLSLKDFLILIALMMGLTLYLKRLDV